MCLVNDSSKITGTLIWYYYICHREVWLMAHEINPEADNVLLDLGRLIHEESYPRNKKEFSTPGMKIDVITERDGELIVGEIKKSSSFIDASKMQLIYYLYRLRQMGIKAKGELLIPKERKRISVELTNEQQCMLETTMQGIREITALSTPPPPMRISFCHSCAYAEFCWG